MTSLVTEHFGAPSGERDARAQDFARRRAAHELAGRTVWAAAALPRGRDAAERLASGLGWAAGSGVRAGRIDVTAEEPLEPLAQFLDAMLRGTAAPLTRPGDADERLCAECIGASEALMGADVRADDVVVLHDPLTALFAQAIRERGAFAVWHVSVTAAAPEEAATAALGFLRRFTAGMDAYVATSAGRLTAAVPAAGVVAAKEVEMPAAPGDPAAGPYESLGWSGLLADVVQGRHGECVGGTLHVRPVVAAR
jgi:hypothetical protein